MSVYGLSRVQWRQIVASWAGWLMDGYSSMAYVLMAVIIAPVFFPASLPPSLRLVFTFLGFAVGGAARPVGSLVFGNFIGDRLGRKQMLVLTIIGFSISAASLGALPSFVQMGFISPFLLYIILFIEGMFAGAEYGGGTALSMESIPAEKRNFIGAFVQSGFGMGFVLISFTSLILSYTLGDALIASYGWRILFATALIPGVAALLIRRGVEETQVFERMEKQKEVERIPILSMVKESPRSILVGIILISGLLYVNASTFNFYPSVLLLNGKSYFSMSLVSLVINAMSLAGVLSGGAIAAKIGGRKRPMLAFSVIFIVTIYPLIMLGVAHSYYYVYAMVFFGIQAVIEAMIFSTIPAFLAESFSKRYRTTAVSFTYNSGGIAAGFALAIIALGIPVLGLTGSWLLNIGVASLVMLLGILISKETWKRGEDLISD